MKPNKNHRICYKICFNKPKKKKKNAKNNKQLFDPKPWQMSYITRNKNFMMFKIDKVDVDVGNDIDRVVSQTGYLNWSGQFNA